MVAFIAKIRAQDCPEGNGRPKRLDDWAPAIFEIPRPRSLKDDNLRSHDIGHGDQVYIWVHETAGGSGLTATGRVGEVRHDGEKVRLLIETLTLETPPLGWDKLRPFGEANSTLRALDVFTLSQTLWLPEQRHLDFLHALTEVRVKYAEQAAAAALRLGLATSKPSLEAAALTAEAREVEQEIQRRYQLVERRLGQSAFRNALIERYDGCCCISGSNVLETLEAAHIVPFAEGHQFRDDPRNGILLRADIHLLFDLHLIGIRPHSHELVLNQRLASSIYAEFSGKSASVSAADEFLAYHLQRVQQVTEPAPRLTGF